MQSVFAVTGAKHSTGSETAVQIESQAPRVPRTNDVQKEYRIMKTTIKRQWKEEEEASTEDRKTSKLIAYISTRLCKVYQYKSAMQYQGQINVVENSSIHGFKSIQLTPN